MADYFKNQYRVLLIDESEAKVLAPAIMRAVHHMTEILDTQRETLTEKEKMEILAQRSYMTGLYGAVEQK